MSKSIKNFAVILMAACLFVMTLVAAQSTHAATQPPSFKSATIYFNTAYIVSGTSVRDYCVISGPGGTTTYDNPLVTVAQQKGADVTQCQQALKQVKAQLEHDYPTTAFDFVIEGRSLNTI